MSSSHGHGHAWVVSLASPRTSVEPDESNGCLVLDHLTLGELRVGKESPQQVRQAAGCVAQLTLIRDQKRMALQQLAENQRQRVEEAKTQQLLSNLEGATGAEGSEGQSIQEFAELNAAKEDAEKLVRIVEELSAVLFMLHRGYCGGEVFDCAMEKLGAIELLTTIYQPVGK